MADTVLHTNCLTPEQLAIYFADELAQPIQELVEEHLATCDACSDLADDIAECAVRIFEEEDSGNRSSDAEDLEWLRQMALENMHWVQRVLDHDSVEEVLRRHWTGLCDYIEPVVLEDLIAGDLELATPTSGGFNLSQKRALEDLSNGLDLIDRISNLIARFHDNFGRKPSTELVATALGGTEVINLHPPERITAVVNSVLDTWKDR